jgi:endonuclease/exonuclease/phosphatase family metal-dependent hydrolase
MACAACGGGDAPAPTPEPAAELCVRQPILDSLPLPQSYDYTWSCTGVVPPADRPLPAEPAAADCTTGVWPDLDDTVDVCPTVSDVRRSDPVSGKELPTPDGRSLPVDIPITEAGSFLPADMPPSWPNRMRVVAWNMEYTAQFDEQLEVLTSHPELSRGDVFLLSEVDRCSQRNGTRRAARLLAEALGGAYVYGIEFVELDIGRSVGGDTGQAIVSRRPLSSAVLSCHSSQADWFANDGQPRLGQRVVLHADVPLGAGSVRVAAVHLESEDVAGDKRSVQSKELLDLGQALACERPQILAGDFNAPYCGAPELEVLRHAGFVDAVALTGDLAPTHQGGFRLDYLWARGLTVIAAGVERDVVASDHHPLWVDLELEGIQ